MKKENAKALNKYKQYQNEKLYVSAVIGDIESMQEASNNGAYALTKAVRLASANNQLEAVKWCIWGVQTGKWNNPTAKGVKFLFNEAFISACEFGCIEMMTELKKCGACNFNKGLIKARAMFNSFYKKPTSYYKYHDKQLATQATRHICTINLLKKWRLEQLAKNQTSFSSYSHGF